MGDEVIIDDKGGATQPALRLADLKNAGFAGLTMEGLSAPLKAFDYLQVYDHDSDTLQDQVNAADIDIVMLQAFAYEAETHWSTITLSRTGSNAYPWNIRVNDAMKFVSDSANGKYHYITDVKARARHLTVWLRASSSKKEFGGRVYFKLATK